LDFYETAPAPVSISYGPAGKCALPATAKRLRILTRIRRHVLPPDEPADSRRAHRKEQPMLDVILLAAGLGFFALSIAYAFGCDRL
jgi:hypothetical protein